MAQQWAALTRLSKPQPDGLWHLRLTPLELIDRIAALIPPPHVHRHRYHGVLAPNSPLRAAVVALAQATTSTSQPPQAANESESAAEPLSVEPLPAEPLPAERPLTKDEPPPSASRSPAHYTWVMLLARIFEILPLSCPHCGGEIRIIAFVTEAATIQSILNCVGEPITPPPISPARGPPLWDDTEGHANDFDELAQPEPEHEFDQRISW